MPSFEGVYGGKAVHLSVPIKVKPNTKVTVTFPDETDLNSGETVTLDMVAGCLKWSGPPKTSEDMEAAIARGASEPIS